MTVGRQVRNSFAAGLWVAFLLLSLSRQAQAQLQRVLVISVPDRKLAVIEDGTVKKVYPVAVGKDSTPSPAGVFLVVDRVADPTYYHAGKVVPPGTANPLGTRWMGLSQKGYGIHGTNASHSIGKAASHGCIRMAKADIEELFSRAQVGDTVLIRRERDHVTAQIFQSYVPAVSRVTDLPPTALEVSAGQ
jgi:lipoprotein-anchoring transpeptidase ErfK/SrfK